MVSCDTLRNELVGNRFRPAATQRNVDRVVTGVVRVSVDRHIRSRTGFQLFSDPLQHLLRTMGKGETVGLEVDRRSQ